MYLLPFHAVLRQFKQQKYSRLCARHFSYTTLVTECGMWSERVAGDEREVDRFDTILIWRHTSSMHWHVPMANLNAIRVFYVVVAFCVERKALEHWQWNGLCALVAFVRPKLIETRHIFRRRQLVERQCTATSINDHRLVGGPISSVECKRIVSVATCILQFRRHILFFLHSPYHWVVSSLSVGRCTPPIGTIEKS